MEAMQLLSKCEMEAWTDQAQILLRKWNSGVFSDVDALEEMDWHRSKLDRKLVEGDTVEGGVWLISHKETESRRRFRLVCRNLNAVAFDVWSRLREEGRQGSEHKPSLRVFPASIDRAQYR